MNTLITGGLGFQGVHLAVWLTSKGHNVILLNTPSDRAQSRAEAVQAACGPGSCQISYGSVTDPGLLAVLIREVDLVVHMAAVTNPEAAYEGPLQAIETNVTGTACVLEAIRARGAEAPRLLHVSTCEVYGSSDGALQDENHPFRPQTIYAASKAAADRLVFAYAQSYNIQALIVRPANVFGPGQRDGAYGAVIPTFISCALRGQTLQVHTPGTQQREYIYISDVIHGYALLIDRLLKKGGHGQAFNLGGIIRVTIRQLAEEIGQELEIRETCDLVPSARPVEPRSFRLDYLLAQDLGYRPRVKLAGGLRQTIAAVRQGTIV